MVRHRGSLRRYHAAALLVALVMLVMPLAGVAAAKTDPPQIVSPEVIHTRTGPTGYEVTFRYYDPTATRVRLRGEWFFSDAAHTTLTAPRAGCRRSGYRARSPSRIPTMPMNLTGRCTT